MEPCGHPELRIWSWKVPERIEKLLPLWVCSLAVGLGPLLVIRVKNRKWPGGLPHCQIATGHLSTWPALYRVLRSQVHSEPRPSRIASAPRIFRRDPGERAGRPRKGWRAGVASPEQGSHQGLLGRPHPYPGLPR